MGLYKIIANNKVTDVVKDPVWVKDGRNGFPVRCDVKEACGIVGRDEEVIFQIDGAPLMSQEYEKVSIADIEEQEYQKLKTILEMDGTVNDETAEIEWPKEPEPIEETNEDLMSVIERKIEILRELCQLAIEAGVDVVLGDGKTKHFDLTVEDQINLMFAKEAIAAGETSILFKASGEDLCYYSPEDIALISVASARCIAYQRAYFESLRKWVQDAQSIVEVGQRHYGENVPEKYWSEVFKSML